MNWPGEDERMARALEGGPVPEDRRLAGLVAVADRVRTAGRDPRLDPTPAFRDELRARLLEQLPRPRPAPPEAISPGPIPAGWTPAGSMPPRSMPPGSMPAGSTPAGSMPAGSTPAGSMPAGSTPAGSMPAGSTPAGSMPAGSMPPGSMPAGSGGRHRQRSGAPAGRRDGSVRPGLRGRRRGAAAILVAAVALSGSTLVASSGALPGDPLYGLKRRVQGVEVVLARGDDARGHRHLELARTRAEELRTAAGGPAGPLVSALEDMDRQTRTGVRLLASVAVRKSDQGRLGEITGWVGEQRRLLTPIAGRLPGPAQASGAASLELLTAVTLRVSSLRATLPCDCPAPATDELGPLPCSGCGRTPSGGPGGGLPAAPTAPTTPPTATAGPGPVPPGSPSGVPASPAPPSGSPVPGSPGTTWEPLPMPTATQPAPSPPESSTPPQDPPSPDPTEPAGPLGAVPELVEGVLDSIGLGG